MERAGRRARPAGSAQRRQNDSSWRAGGVRRIVAGVRRPRAALRGAAALRRRTGAAGGAGCAAEAGSTASRRAGHGPWIAGRARVRRRVAAHLSRRTARSSAHLGERTAAVAEAGLVRTAAVVAADLARDAAAAEAPARVETRLLSLAAVAAAYPVGRAARAAGLADVRWHTAALAAYVLRRTADAERVHARRSRRGAAVVAADVATVGRAARDVGGIAADGLVRGAALLAATLVPHVVVEAAETGARVGAMHVVVHSVAAHRAAALRARGAARLAAAAHRVLRAAGPAGVAVTAGA